MPVWNLPFDPYPLIKPLLFMQDPEAAHERTIKLLSLGLGPRASEPDDPILKTTVCGLEFPNPIGLAAGLDKQASAIDAFMNFGFGHVEVGTVTPLPQSGNPRPRMFRVPEANALINRFGFNSVGADVVAERMKAWRENPRRTRNPVGINLGKNKDSADDAADYIAGLIKLAPYADYVTINISSPNTAGLRDLQRRERLAELLGAVMEARAIHAPRLPIFVKIAPDLTDAQQEDIAAIAVSSGVHGIIVGNTTVTRPAGIPPELAAEAGGLSGKPLFDLSTQVLGNMWKLTDGKIPLIGCGGVSTGADAYRKIRAGASLVQIYTALVYEGPLVVRRIKRELAELLQRDGFASVGDAVGKT